MNGNWIRKGLILSMLLLSLISISTAACPRAMPELYQGKCGNVLSVPAPGILKNDVKDPGKSLKVFNPDDISIDPKLGTLTVNEDGSFVYEASDDFKASAYVLFYYRATDGKCESNQAYVKIAVSCPCRGVAPDITVCQDEEVDEELLMSKGAKCSGCRDVTPGFDLSKIAAAPGTYPYKVICPGPNTAQGHVTVEPPCVISWQDFTVGPDEVVDEEMILENGQVTCSCNPLQATSGIVFPSDCTIELAISDIAKTEDGNGYSYTITCTSCHDCPSTAQGHVTIEASEPPIVTLFEDFNFEGRSMQVSSNTPWVGNDFDDIVSSLQVPDGYVVELYEHINYGGRFKAFSSGDNPWVGDEFNDITSSLKIFRDVDWFPSV